MCGNRSFTVSGPLIYVGKVVGKTYKPKYISGKMSLVNCYIQSGFLNVPPPRTDLPLSLF